MYLNLFTYFNLFFILHIYTLVYIGGLNVQDIPYLPTFGV